MKTIHLHMSLSVPEHAAIKASEHTVEALKRAMHTFSIVHGVDVAVEEEEVVILDAPKTRKRKAA